MDIVRDLLKNMSSDSKYSVYLREIALLMEEIDLLRVKLEENEKLVKNYEKQIRGEKS